MWHALLLCLSLPGRRDIVWGSFMPCGHATLACRHTRRRTDVCAQQSTPCVTSQMRMSASIGVLLVCYTQTCLCSCSVAWICARLGRHLYDALKIPAHSTIVTAPFVLKAEIQVGHPMLLDTTISHSHDFYQRPCSHRLISSRLLCLPFSTSLVLAST